MAPTNSMDSIFNELNPQRQTVPKMNEDLEQTMDWLKAHITTYDGNPVGYMMGGGSKHGSIFAPKTTVDGGVGQLNLKRPVADLVRKVMQQEIRLRGPAPAATDEVSAMASKLLRGTWFRGQKNVPEPVAVTEKGLAIKHTRKVPFEDDEVFDWVGKPDLRHARISKPGNVG